MSMKTKIKLIFYCSEYAGIYTRFVCVVVADVADDVAVVVADESGVADVGGSGKFAGVKV